MEVQQAVQCRQLCVHAGCMLDGTKHARATRNTLLLSALFCQLRLLHVKGMHRHVVGVRRRVHERSLPKIQAVPAITRECRG